MNSINWVVFTRIRETTAKSDY